MIHLQKMVGGLNDKFIKFWIRWNTQAKYRIQYISQSCLLQELYLVLPKKPYGFGILQEKKEDLITHLFTLKVIKKETLKTRAKRCFQIKTLLIFLTIAVFQTSAQTWHRQTRYSENSIYCFFRFLSLKCLPRTCAVTNNPNRKFITLVH